MVSACYRKLFETGWKGNLKHECSEGSHRDISMTMFSKKHSLKAHSTDVTDLFWPRLEW